MIMQPGEHRVVIVKKKHTQTHTQEVMGVPIDLVSSLYMYIHVRNLPNVYIVFVW